MLPRHRRIRLPIASPLCGTRWRLWPDYSWSASEAESRPERRRLSFL